MPYKDAIKTKIPKELEEKQWFGNLEGPLLKSSSAELKNPIVFNDYDAIKYLTNTQKFAFSLANNHIMDVGEINGTIQRLSNLEVGFLGAGNNLEEASKPLHLKMGNEHMIILSYGWSPIQCEPAKKKKPGVNPLKKQIVLKEVKMLRKEFPQSHIILYVHWNYELEKYPMPLHRDLAFKSLDAGANAVIGAHPHRVQGVEEYKGKPIIYSLGNWLFKQNCFMNGKVSYPDFSRDQMAFEYDFNNKHKLHFFKYTMDDQVKYVESVNWNKKSSVSSLSDFPKNSSLDYQKWFKKNREKKKMLPIYKYNDSTFMEMFKTLWVKYFRHSLVLWLKRFN